MAASMIDKREDAKSFLSVYPRISNGGNILWFVAIWLALVEISWVILSWFPISRPSFFIYIIAILMLFVAARTTSFITHSFCDSPPSKEHASRRTVLVHIVTCGSILIVGRGIYSVLPDNPLRRAPAELFLQDKQDITTVGPHTLKDFEILSDTDTPVDILVLINSSKRYTTPAHVEMAKVSRHTTKFLVVVDHHEAAYETWRTFRKAGVTNLDRRLRFMLSEEVRNGGSDLLCQWAQDAINVLYSQNTQEFTIANIPPLLRRDPPFTVAYNIVGNQMAEKDIPWVSIVKNSFDSLPLLGGEITSDDQFVYIAKGSHDIKTIEDFTNRRVIVLPRIDTTHTDLFHAPVGDTKFGKHTSVLPDPVAYFEIIQSLTHGEKQEAIRDIKRLAPTAPLPLTTQRGLIDYGDVWERMLNISSERLEAIKQSEYVDNLNHAQQILTENGIEVLRVPGIPLKGFPIDVPFGIYPTNILQDIFVDEAGNTARSVYIPKYGIKKVDKAIEEFYRGLGVFKDVYAVPAADEGLRWGGIRCRFKKIGIPIAKRVIKLDGQVDKQNYEQRKLLGGFSLGNDSKDTLTTFTAPET